MMRGPKARVNEERMAAPWHVVYCAVFWYGPFAVAKIGCSSNFQSRARYVRKTASQMFGRTSKIYYYVIVAGSYDIEELIGEHLQGFELFPLGPPRVRSPRARAGWSEWVFWNEEVAQYIQSFAPIGLSSTDSKLKLTDAIRAARAVKAAAVARAKRTAECIEMTTVKPKATRRVVYKTKSHRA